MNAHSTIIDKVLKTADFQETFWAIDQWTKNNSMWKGGTLMTLSEDLPLFSDPTSTTISRFKKGEELVYVGMRNDGDGTLFEFKYNGLSYFAWTRNKLMLNDRFEKPAWWTSALADFLNVREDRLHKRARFEQKNRQLEIA